MVIMNNANTTERLIQEVRARPPLWDQRNLNYHNRVVVNALWQDIADSLQINKETVKVKWKGLRDTYRRELKKQRSNANSGLISENIRDPSWTHYSSMNFLREYMGNNHNHNDIFQFHGWSAEEMPSADEASIPNDETTLNALIPATSNITDMVDDSAASPNATSSRSSDSASEDETVGASSVTAKGEPVKTEPTSSEVPNNDSSLPAAQMEANPQEPTLGSSAATVTVAITRKSKNGEKKRSSLTSLSRLSRMKEHHRLRSKLSKKHSIAKDYHQQSPTLTIHHHGVDMDEDIVSTPATMATATVSGHTTVTSGGRNSTIIDESDDDLYFFKSLIPFVKNLPPTRKLYLRAEIHNLVLRELMGDGSCNSGVIPLEHVAVGMNA